MTLQRIEEGELQKRGRNTKVEEGDMYLKPRQRKARLSSAGVCTHLPLSFPGTSLLGISRAWQGERNEKKVG